jgi:hypothetical protein
VLLRPRAEHEVEGITDDPEQIRRNWANAKIDAQHLLEEAADLRRVREIGRLAGVPPWDITKAMLAHADVVICDYNYVFSPRNRAALETVPGWDMADTVLVVDEAHNLPERAAECLSLRDDEQSAADFAFTLTRFRAPEAWCQTAQRWADFLRRLPEGRRHLAGRPPRSDGDRRTDVGARGRTSVQHRRPARRREAGRLERRVMARPPRSRRPGLAALVAPPACSASTASPPPRPPANACAPSAMRC